MSDLVILQALSRLPFGLSCFRPKVSFSLDVPGFVVKTADAPAELESALRLRHDAFYVERLGRSLPGGLDVDRYDALADHVLVIDETDGSVAATYRILCSLFTDRFYSETEFDLGSLLGPNRVHLELGRACTSRAHRGGMALALVWKGLARYARLTGASDLFGTSSMDRVDPTSAYGVLEYLRKTGQTAERGTSPEGDYRFRDTPDPSELAKPEAFRDLVPPLLRSYLRAGAVVCGEPGLDLDLRTTDYLTLLDLAAMNPRFAARFFSA